jgi:MFS family permease
MKNNIKALTASSYMSMLFLGVSTGLIGAIATNIDITPFQIGLFLAIQNVGFMIAVSISGALADSVEKTRILLVGSLILALSFFTFYLTESLWLNMFIMMMHSHHRVSDFLGDELADITGPVGRHCSDSGGGVRCLQADEETWT